MDSELLLLRRELIVLQDAFYLSHQAVSDDHLSFRRCLINTRRTTDNQPFLAEILAKMKPNIFSSYR